MNHCDLYVLNAHGEPVREKDLMRWGFFFDRQSRQVARDEIVPEVVVSTIFLGLNQRVRGKGPPILWETIVIAHGVLDRKWMKRCTGNREQAEAMHATMLAKAKKHFGGKRSLTDGVS